MFNKYYIKISSVGAIMILMAPAFGCSGSKTCKVETSLDSSNLQELPMPHIPDSVISIEERAAFAAHHFWDALDFGQDCRSMDTTFMEQNFVNYLAVLSVTPEPVAQSAVKLLRKKAKSSQEVADLLDYIADRYLDDPNSPMRNEEMYILFLRDIVDDRSLPDDKRDRANYRLNQTMKNRVGNKGADFKFIDRNGKSTSLYASLGEALTLVMFYDPDCEQCKAVKEILTRSQIYAGMKIIAIDTMGDRDKWEETKDSFPVDWTVGFAADPIEEEEIYVIRAMPTFYIFDKEGRVVMKDPPIEKILGE